MDKGPDLTKGKMENLVRMDVILKKIKDKQEAQEVQVIGKKENSAKIDVFKKDALKSPITTEKGKVPEEESEKNAGMFSRLKKDIPDQTTTTTADTISEKLPLGKILLKRGNITKEQLLDALEFQKSDEAKNARKVYFEALRGVRKIFNAYKKGEGIKSEVVVNLGNKIVDSVVLSTQYFLKLFHEADSLRLHRYLNAVNVSILSTVLGIANKFDADSLLDLAVIGLLHDLDLIKNNSLLNKTTKLNEEEIKVIRKHPLNTVTYLDHAFKLKDKIVKSILQHHERKKSQGYPSGLREQEIHEFAVIVGLADTYEAMTHSRTYKSKLTPHKAILSIINDSKDLFPYEEIKKLVSCVGVYPVGSEVELNTGEICQVVAANPEHPLRPVVRIVMDKEEGEESSKRELRMVDLIKSPSLYINKEIVQGSIN